MTNREIAERAFVSPKTVEANIAAFTASWASARVPNLVGRWLIWSGPAKTLGNYPDPLHGELSP